MTFISTDTAQCPGIINKYESTIDQELADTAAFAPDIHCVCISQVAALFCVKCRHGRHLEIVTSY